MCSSDLEPVDLASIRHHPVSAFAGIAKPERFFNTLQAMGLTLAEQKRFPDHHRYSAGDLNDLKGEMRITTEKDAVRLEKLGNGEFMHLRISVNIQDSERLMTLILSRLQRA